MLNLAKTKRALSRLTARVSANELRSAIGRVTDGGCDTLYLHSGISSLGYLTPGLDGTADILREFCGTLFQVQHSYCYPTSEDQPAPIFDARTTPSEMGSFAEAFRGRPGVIRSIHSTHSIAGEGLLAEEYCAKHYECDTPCGVGTPYSRIVHSRSAALMFGVDFSYYTPFHTAEWEAESAFAYEPGEVNLLRFIDENGILQERLRKRQNRIVPRFKEAGDLLERHGFVTRVPLGRGHLLYISDMLKAHGFLVDRLKKMPDFLRSTCRAELT